MARQKGRQFFHLKTVTESTLEKDKRALNDRWDRLGGERGILERFREQGKTKQRGCCLLKCDLPRIASPAWGGEDSLYKCLSTMSPSST